MSRNLRLLVAFPFAVAFLGFAFAQTPASQAPRLTTSEIDACFSALADFKLGDDLTLLRKLSAYVESLTADAPEARQLEARFVALLGSKARLEAKDFACRQLALIGGEASLAALENTVVDQPSIELIAFYALERIPGSGPVLRKMLTNSRQLPIISALGRRRDPEAVPLLKPLTANKDAPGVAKAAVRALGMIGTPLAAAALEETRRSTTGEERHLAGLSLLECAEQMAAAGQTRQAAAIFRDLNGAGESAQLRFGALRGLALLVKDSAVASDLVAFIKAEDPKLAANAIQVLAEMPGPAPIRALGDALPALQAVSKQQAIILALADRPDAKGALPAVVQAGRSSAPELRAAAWTAVGRLGDATHVPLLVTALSSADQAERTAARQALAAMASPSFDNALVDQLGKAAPETKLEIIGVIEERRMAAAADPLMAIVKQNDGSLRSASLKALRRTASDEQVPALVDLLASSTVGTDSQVLEETIASLLRQSPRHVGLVVKRFNESQDSSRRARLAAGLRGVGSPEALSLLKEAIIAPRPETQRAAILSLSDWPDAAPIPDLLAVARQTGLDPSLRTLALRGSLRLLGQPPNRSHAESVSVLREILDLAPDLAEKKAALALVERFPSPDALAMAQSALADPALSAEAKTALEHTRAAAAGDARLLVYTRNYASSGEVYVHDNIASSVAAIEKLGRENGFSIDVTDQPSAFTEENLAKYKAVVFANSNGEAFENDEQRGAFQRYIRRGGGFVGIHSACASEAQWPWFWSLIGGTFDFHPPFQRFTIRVVDKKHPSTAFFETDTWAWEDEFYILKERNDKVCVLLAGNLKSLGTPGDNPERLAGQPDPCPLAWYHEFESGRSWYTALGHRKEHYEDPTYLKHLLGGILWVLDRQ